MRFPFSALSFLFGRLRHSSVSPSLSSLLPPHAIPASSLSPLSSHVLPLAFRLSTFVTPSLCRSFSALLGEIREPSHFCMCTSALCPQLSNLCPLHSAVHSPHSAHGFQHSSFCSLLTSLAHCSLLPAPRGDPRLPRAGFCICSGVKFGAMCA